MNIDCGCFFCLNNKEHPDWRHTSFEPTTHLLLKAESLDPKDSIALEACNTCGHIRIAQH